MPYKARNCVKCKKAFEPNSSAQKYCKNCLVRVCQQCKKKFFVENPQYFPKFCGAKCYFKNRWHGKRKITNKCIFCEKEFFSYLSNKRKFCSNKCYRQWRTINKIKSGHWKGGRIRYGSYNKYWAIYQPYHPFADGKGYVMEHRLIMEKHLKRFLKKSEVVHHINGNTMDNRIQNLRLFLKKEHDRFHTIQRWQNHKIKPFRKSLT